MYNNNHYSTCTFVIYTWISILWMFMCVLKNSSLLLLYIVWLKINFNWCLYEKDIILQLFNRIRKLTGKTCYSTVVNLWTVGIKRVDITIYRQWLKKWKFFSKKSDFPNPPKYIKWINAFPSPYPLQKLRRKSYGFLIWKFLKAMHAINDSILNDGKTACFR